MCGKKLAVFFPGIGYHNDKPLLYYSRKLAAELGFEVIEITYDFSFKANEIKGDKDKMRDSFEVAYEQTSEQLSEVDFAGFKQVFFIGKSLGTTVAAYYDKQHDVGARHIVLTPVPRTFDYLRKDCGIVFHGNADPWCETDLATEKCSELGLPLNIVEGGNHSLETKSILTDVHNMEDILGKIDRYMRGE